MSQQIQTAAVLILLTIQLIASVFDVLSKRIPGKLIVFSLAAAAGFSFLFYRAGNVNEHLLGSLMAFCIMALLIMISKGQIGGGDLALAAVTGFFAGKDWFPAILFFSMLLTGVYSSFLIITGKGTKNTEVPYAPFIFIATVIIAVWR